MNRKKNTRTGPGRALRLAWWALFFLFALAPPLSAASPPERTLLAGHEERLPADAPSRRIDPLGATSPFNFIGALSISSGDSSFLGSASAISPEWVLTAGHNLDTDDDGAADTGLSATFYLPEFGEFSGVAYHTHPDFAGFSNSIHNDLGLIRLADPLPADLNFPGFPTGPAVGDTVTLAGFGRSGFGSYGYTTDASLTDRRIGKNTIETFTAGEDGATEIFRYTFGHPDTYGEPGGSLGNDVETIIGPGDSGGPVLVEREDGYGFVGVSTFTEGFGGRFGDIGGGVVLDPYYDWISETTGVVIPEPAFAAWAGGAAVLSMVLWKRFGKTSRSR